MGRHARWRWQGSWRTCSISARVNPWEDMRRLAADHHQSKTAVCTARGIRKREEDGGGDGGMYLLIQGLGFKPVPAHRIKIKGGFVSFQRAAYPSKATSVSAQRSATSFSHLSLGQQCRNTISWHSSQDMPFWPEYADSVLLQSKPKVSPSCVFQQRVEVCTCRSR